MNTPHDSPPPPPPEEIELSHDKELWNLLGEASTEEASPLFGPNVVRQIRLQERSSGNSGQTTPKISFWQKLAKFDTAAPRFALPGALVAAAALVLIATLLWPPPSNPTVSSPIAQNPGTEQIPAEIASSLEISLESELLIAAADTPDLFSDEEVFAMLF